MEQKSARSQLIGAPPPVPGAIRTFVSMYIYINILYNVYCILYAELSFFPLRDLTRDAKVILGANTRMMPSSCRTVTW